LAGFDVQILEDAGNAGTIVIFYCITPRHVPASR
jgi:hypothetical protein